MLPTIDELDFCYQVPGHRLLWDSKFFINPYTGLCYTVRKASYDFTQSPVYAVLAHSLGERPSIENTHYTRGTLEGIYECLVKALLSP